MDTTPIRCNFPGCTARLGDAHYMWAPDLSMVASLIGRAVKLEDLALHVLCGRHAHAGREAGGRFYRIDQTAAALAKREAERDFFSRYAKKPKADPRFDRLAAEKREASRRPRPRGNGAVSGAALDRVMHA